MERRVKMTRMARHGWMVAAAATTWISGSGMAYAAEPGPDALPINVIAIQTSDADDQAEALTKALRTTVRSLPGWSLADGDYSLEVLSLTLKCSEPPDADCQSRIADQIHADRFVWGLLNMDKGNQTVSGELNLWVRGKGTKKAALKYSANLTESDDDSLKKVALVAVNSVTGGPPNGELRITAGGVTGQVFVNGQPFGALTGGKGSIFLPVGQHKIVVKAQGYADAATTVSVKPTAPTDVTLSPIPLEPEKQINWKKIGGYAAIGAGGAFAVVGLVGTIQVATIRSNFEGNEFVKRTPSNRNACDEARKTPGEAGAYLAVDLCDKASTFQTLQFVFYPLAAAAAGAGVFLVVTSGGSEEAPKTGFTILPQVGPGGAKLDVGYRF
jgi:hypothetical protein